MYGQLLRISCSHPEDCWDLARTFQQLAISNGDGAWIEQ